jgi:hypothetical protein
MFMTTLDTLVMANALPVMLPAFISAGIGMGLVFASSSTAMRAHTRHEGTAKASGANSTLREIGVALGIAVLAAVSTPTSYVDAVVPAV